MTSTPPHHYVDLNYFGGNIDSGFGRGHVRQSELRFFFLEFGFSPHFVLLRHGLNPPKADPTPNIWWTVVSCPNRESQKKNVVGPAVVISGPSGSHVVQQHLAQGLLVLGNVTPSEPGLPSFTN